MKKNILILLSLITFTAMAQTKGKFEVLDLKSFKLHVYYTNDALNDASYIVEGKNGLITLEQPLFKDNVAEFDAYVTSLNKPVQKIISDYHVGGTGNHDIVMAEGMPAFTKGATYDGMMRNFAEIKFGSKQTWDNIEFYFDKGASTDFPAASIIIGNKVYYTHWTPVKAHISYLQISSPATIDAEIAEAEKALKSGCEYFIGGHGGATGRESVEFKIDYLKKMKQILRENSTAERFISAMTQTFPSLPGENNLTDLAKALYKH